MAMEKIIPIMYLEKNYLKKNNFRSFICMHIGGDYKRLSMHAIPIAGQTRNTYGSRHSYEEGGGRNRKETLLSQWIKG